MVASPAWPRRQVVPCPGGFGHPPRGSRGATPPLTDRNILTHEELFASPVRPAPSWSGRLPLLHRVRPFRPAGRPDACTGRRSDTPRLLPFPADRASKLHQVGADKVTVSIGFVERPGLVREIADTFGQQCGTVSMDVRRTANEYEASSHCGTTATGHAPTALATVAVSRIHHFTEMTPLGAKTDLAERGFPLRLPQPVHA